jgi:hypothetical protein
MGPSRRRSTFSPESRDTQWLMREPAHPELCVNFGRMIVCYSERRRSGFRAGHVFNTPSLFQNFFLWIE